MIAWNTNKSVQDVCNWVELELYAGMILVPKNDVDEAWNHANRRAIDILRNYKRGQGLFQLEREEKEGER